MDSNKIKQYYDAEIEKNRLELDFCMLEGIRTKEIISRYLAKSIIAISPHIMALARKENV